MASDDEKKGRERSVQIRAQFPQTMTEEEKKAIIDETENEIIDSLTGDQAVSFIKAKAQEKTEFTVEVTTEKAKTIF